MRVDQAPEAGKTRATAAAAINGQIGLWGDADMLVVALNASGLLILPTGPGDVYGVIWLGEGVKNTEGATALAVVGGRKYTVFKRAEFVEVEEGGTPLIVGQALYADAAPAGGIGANGKYVGTVLADKNGTAGRLVVDIGLLPDVP